MLKRFFAFLILCFSVQGIVQAQSAQLSTTSESYHLLERMEIKSGNLSNTFHTNIKPFQRRDIIDFLSSIDTLAYLKLSPVDHWNLDYLRTDSWEFLDSLNEGVANSEKVLLKNIYEKKGDFYYFRNEDFDIHASPIFHFLGGRSGNSLEPTRDLFVNTRGVEIRGTVNDKLGFYTYFTENQSTPAFYERNYVLEQGAFPYYGFTKVAGEDSVAMKRDYIGAEGYMVFRPSKSIMLRFGHSKNFVGSGIRSMVLSDVTAPYLNLGAEVKLGRLQYSNIFALMSDFQVERPVDNSVTIPSKFMAFHHLNLNVTKNLNIGLFEKVMFGRDNNSFDINYLNPLIFYRFIEGFSGSSDNAMVGVDFKWNVFKTASIYGQFVLDEFKLSEWQEDGWWGEKHAGQLGIKYIDALGIKQLDLQAEVNYSRPYTFSHYSSSSNAVHYNIPTGHPLGANFSELLLRARYQPFAKLSLVGTYMTYQKGFDADSTNYGGNILRNNRFDRPDDYGNFTGQGANRVVQMGDIRLSYMLRHNLFLDLNYLHRRSRSEELGDETEDTFRFGVRLNFGREDNFF